jgi:hypothetical protein
MEAKDGHWLTNTALLLPTWSISQKNTCPVQLSHYLWNKWIWRKFSKKTSTMNR